MNRVIIPVLVLCTVALDQFSKYLASLYLSMNEPVEVVKNIFYLTLIHNTGAAFGIFRQETPFFIIISILAVLGILYYLKKERDIPALKNIALALILAGATGNLIDRLRFGYVIDFFDFRIWPVFNVADSAVTVGAGILIVSLCIQYCSR